MGTNGTLSMVLHLLSSVSRREGGREGVDRGGMVEGGQGAGGAGGCGGREYEYGMTCRYRPFLGVARPDGWLEVAVKHRYGRPPLGHPMRCSSYVQAAAQRCRVVCRAPHAARLRRRVSEAGGRGGGGARD